MEITKAEQLSLMMLCDIYEAVKPEERIDTVLIREALYTGNFWAIEASLSGLFPVPINPQIKTEVVNILDMWRFIEEASDEKFPGFDSSRESEHHSAAKIMIEYLEWHESFQGRFGHGILGLDSYRRMLNEFSHIRPTLGTRHPIRLTEDEVKLLLDQRIHPDNR